MRKIKLFGRSIPVMVLAVLAMATVGSAALLTYYGRIVTTVTVEQSILLDGEQYTETITDTILESAPGGEEFCFLHKIQNQASVDILVDFTTTEIEGIETYIYTVPETTTLELCEKDTDWTCKGNGATATLTFDPVSPTFKGTLTTTNLDGTNYALIYYPDVDPRFTTWGGAGGIVIATFTGDQPNLAIDVDLGVNLPNIGDWNINPVPDYCNKHNGFDSYVHCKGAKIWIVPTSDLTSNTDLPLTVWNPSEYLFETDLITYSDCTEPTGSVYAVDMDKIGPITELTTESKTTTPILICYDFAVNIMPGTYQITTKVQSV